MGFGGVHAYAAVRSDQAYLYDGPGGGLFVGSPSYSYFNGPGFSNIAELGEKAAAV